MGLPCKLYEVYNDDTNVNTFTFANCDPSPCTFTNFPLEPYETFYILTTTNLNLLGSPFTVTDLGETDSYANFSGYCGDDFSLQVPSTFSEFSVGDILCFSGFTGCTAEVNTSYSGGCYELINIAASPSYAITSVTVLPLPIYNGNSINDCLVQCPCGISPSPTPTETPTPTPTSQPTGCGNWTITNIKVFEGLNLEYVDCCDGDKIKELFVPYASGTSVCSLIEPQFTIAPSSSNYIILYAGECICPPVSATPTPTPTVTPTITPTITPTPSPTPSLRNRFKNECEPITIFDLGVSCVVVQPSTQESNDGAASLSISGGTPPYTITWDNGNIAAAIGNLSVGEYGATVVDYYGDFTAKTVCVLTGQTIQPTSTPTPTPTLIPTGPDFCMNASGESTKGVFNISKSFSVDSFINGLPSWISDDNTARIFWDSLSSSWQVSGLTFFSIINPDPTNPPINSNWVINGAYGTVSVTEGNCGEEIIQLLSPLAISNPNITLYVVKNDTICGCEGSIIADADGGNVPYQYSIDGGVTYKNFPIFNNLCAGNYVVTVKDNSGFTQVSTIEINPPLPKSTYSVGLTKTFKTITDNGTVLSRAYQAKVQVNPPLPDNVTITFDLIHSNSFTTSVTETSASINSNTILEKNSTPISLSYSSSTTGLSFSNIVGCQNQYFYISGFSQNWNGLTFSNSDEILINTTSTITKNFTTGCDFADSQDNFLISNVSINGCTCCNVINVST